jgi:hypothetical protein
VEQVFNLDVDKAFLDLVVEGISNKVSVEEGVKVNDCLDNIFPSSRLKIKVNVLLLIVLSHPDHLLLVGRVNNDVNLRTNNSSYSSRVSCHDPPLVVSMLGLLHFNLAV